MSTSILFPQGCGIVDNRLWKSLWRMWKTVSFPHGFFQVPSFPGCEKNTLDAFTNPPLKNTPLFSARGRQKAQPVPLNLKRLDFRLVFLAPSVLFPPPPKKFRAFRQIFLRMLFSPPGDTRRAFHILRRLFMQGKVDICGVSTSHKLPVRLCATMSASSTCTIISGESPSIEPSR